MNDHLASLGVACNQHVESLCRCCLSTYRSKFPLQFSDYHAGLMPISYIGRKILSHSGVLNPPDQGAGKLVPLFKCQMQRIQPLYTNFHVINNNNNNNNNKTHNLGFLTSLIYFCKECFCFRGIETVIIRNIQLK